MELIHIDDYALLIADAIRAKLDVKQTHYSFELRLNKVTPLIKLDKTELYKTIGQLSEFNRVSETVIANSTVYESLIKQEGAWLKLKSFFKSDSYEIKDFENDLTYAISHPSNSFILFLLYEASKISPPQDLIENYQFRINSYDNSFLHNIFDFLKHLLSEYWTLKIKSKSSRTESQFSDLCNAFLFQISFQTNKVIIQQKTIKDRFNLSSIKHMKRSPLANLEPPSHIYDPALIYHYQLATATESPFTAYISFYHIAEHFFEMIFNQAIVMKIKDKLSEPGFSYSNQKDLHDLLKDITSSLRIRNESITFSEQEALYLTILQYVNLSELEKNIIDFDSSLVTYFRTSKVSFSDGDTIDFSQKNRKKISKQLASRIYKTRNALVHSKESKKQRYSPFFDDVILTKEVPLLKFMAEQIIMSTSTRVKNS